ICYQHSSLAFVCVALKNWSFAKMSKTIVDNPGYEGKKEGWFARRSLITQMATGVAAVTVVAMSALTFFVVNHNEKSAFESIEREMTSSMALYEKSLDMVYKSALERGAAMMPGYIAALGGEPQL